MTETSNQSSQNYKFLSDRPLTVENQQNIRFGHTGLAENLKNIVSKCPLPFTIGLFGKWGTGKTTILNLLEDKLHVLKIPLIKFDVWKHEGDALRRTFLKVAVQQLKKKGHLDNDYILNERVNKSIDITRKTEKLNWKNIDGLFYWVSILIILGIIALIVDAYSNTKLFQPYISTIFGGGLIGGILLWFLNRILITEHITEHADRFQDPEEFEDEFFSIVKATNPK